MSMNPLNRCITFSFFFKNIPMQITTLRCLRLAIAPQNINSWGIYSASTTVMSRIHVHLWNSTHRTINLMTALPKVMESSITSMNEMFLPTRVPAEPLPGEPTPRETRAYDPVTIQQHLSLWDSLHFTAKLHARQHLSTVTGDTHIFIRPVINIKAAQPGREQTVRCDELQLDRASLL